MYIYKTTNLINNKIYIGLSTKSVEESTNYYGSGTLILQAIDKYGKDNFKKEILESNIQDRDVLCDLEIAYIAQYNSNHRDIGYNLTSGGDGALGLDFTEERRRKIGEANSGPASPKKYKASLKNMAKARAAVNNFETTEETKQKISESLTGRHWYHNPNDHSQNGQYHQPPAGWVRGRGKKYSRPSGLTYKNSRKD